MQRIRSFLFLTLLGGVSVILPVLLLIVVARWIAQLLLEPLAPLTDRLVTQTEMAPAIAAMLVLFMMVAACFLVGLMVRTRVGALLHRVTDAWFARIAPGYQTIRDTVAQLLGSGSGGLPGGEVALVKLQGRDSAARTTAIVTARHDDGKFTVFVPTAPIPTQGFIWHLPPDCVQLLPEVSMQEAMRTVIACGAGAQLLLDAAGDGEANRT